MLTIAWWGWLVLAAIVAVVAGLVIGEAHDAILEARERKAEIDRARARLAAMAAEASQNAARPIQTLAGSVALRSPYQPTTIAPEEAERTVPRYYPSVDLSQPWNPPIPLTEGSVAAAVEASPSLKQDFAAAGERASVAAKKPQRTGKKRRAKKRGSKRK